MGIEGTIQTGDKVMVVLSGTEMVGRVVDIFPNYAWTGKTWYSVHGGGNGTDQFMTITSSPKKINHCANTQ